MGRRWWSSRLTVLNLAVPRIARRVILARLDGLAKERVEEVFEPQRVARRDDHVLVARERPLSELLETLQARAEERLIALVVHTVLHAKRHRAVEVEALRHARKRHWLLSVAED